jgi:hypothetical protein
MHEQEYKILSIIDSGSWKHSWHLPKNKNGYIKWDSLEARDKVAEIMAEKRLQAESMIARIDAIELPPQSFYD